MRYASLGGSLRHLGGWKISRPDHRDFRLPDPDWGLPHDALIPNVLPVFDQGNLGSCVHNAICSAMHDIDLRDDGLAKTYARLASYARTKELEGVPIGEDSGSEIRNGFKAARLFGIPLESTWPYIRDNYFRELPSIVITEALKYRAILFYHCPSLRAVKASLAQGFPVVFGFSVPENMQTKECEASGEVYYPAPEEAFLGGHAVLAEGFDDGMKIGDCIGAVRFLNSWGEDWGVNGRGWLPYRCFEEHLALDCYTLRRATV